MSELAVATSGINTYFGTPRNPRSWLWHTIPGGSSSGSAVAVANNEADIAFGTDTAGSVRVPAACCGVVGLKTTYGLIPLDGVYPISPNQLDTVGPLARDIAGAVEGMSLLQSGFESRYRQAMASKPTADKIRVGRLRVSGTTPSIDRAVDDALARTGFKVVQLSSEFSDKWAQAQRDAAVVAAVGAWIRDSKFETQPQVAFRTKAIVALGGIQYETAYKGALRRQSAWKSAINEILKDVDFIALPTLQTLPPHLPPFGGTIAFEVRSLNAQNTQAVNFAGVPALAVPIPLRKHSDLVTSLELIGPDRSEPALLNAGRLVEEAIKNR
jgi:Asp-tRNA(Asn)/Glu-tRNA(Gln) amidotransferase A subunit family amidase